MAKKQTKTSGKISKQREIEKKKRKRRKSTLILLMMVLLVGGICAYLLISPSFDIQEISVKGNYKLSYQQIISLAEINRGDNLFSKISIVMKVKLKQNGYIQDAEINKIYPNKIEINIKERQICFQIKTETGEYIYIDEQGYILQYAMDKLEVPTIEGMNITVNEVGTLKRLDENDLNKMENILQIREQCKNIEISDKISEYQVSDDYIICLENEGIIINFGDATNLRDRIDYVKAIMKQETGKTGIIYVNGNLNEGFSPYFSAN